MADQVAGDFVLGIDLGTNSIGWALVGLVDGEPAGVIRAGVRVFEAGMEGDIASGREESRNKARRDARLHRRQLWRRRRRLVRLAHILQRYCLLPEGNVTDPEARQDFLNRLDSAILASPWFAAKEKSRAFPEPRHTMPYILRAAALDEALPPHYLGRALYHLAQRRGFLSGRLKPAKKEDDEGVVKEGIGELRRKMQEGGARTLGEYFSRLSPREERIRSRWTARDMYGEEFDAILAAQAKHHPELLTQERKKELHRAIFYQRPLWFDPNSVGACELEPDCRRAPAYLIVAQRFRLLQTINNLRLLPPGEPERPPTPKEREKLAEALELRGDLTFIQIRKLLGLAKEHVFTLERGGEKRLKGNRTNADFYEIFGDRWRQMSPGERDQAVEYVHAFQKPQKLQEAAKKKWGLDDKAAEKFAAISLEADYMSLSRRAMEKLLPLLEAGVTYGEARRQLYPEQFQASEPKPLLPPVEMALSEIRNPAVMRSLTELRKVVNAIIRQHGEPQEIRIELARELKRSKKQRSQITDTNRKNEKARSEAAKRIIAEAGIPEPKPDDKRKFLLAEECHWQCPYTGRSISVESLFGGEPQFDIEHIIPFSRSLDNSFLNLTLCYVPENRSVKGNKTPHEAYAGDPELYEQIVDRVKRFTGERRTVAEKVRRFKLGAEELENFLSDFRDRQLNDTAYATTLAKRYLGLLYGGEIDANGQRRVQASSGQPTAYFRNLWKLNAILSDGDTSHGGQLPKKRNDHRHHAVDAVVIGLTEPRMIKRLSDAAQRAPLEGRKRFGSLEAPWTNFVDSVRAEIDKVVVSHRVSKKVSGPLHEETIYSRPFPVAAIPHAGSPKTARRSETAATVVRVRKSLAALTKTEVEDIADPKVQELVVKKLAELGGDPKKFADEKNLPRFPTSGVPIRRVRIHKAVPTFPLGEGRTARHVTPESNHHVEIYSVRDKKGRERWAGEVVSMFEAYQRLRNRRPLVEKNHGPEAEFKFSLASGEVIECNGEAGKQELLVLRGISQFESGYVDINLARLNDARQKAEIIKSGQWVRIGPNRLAQLAARKVVVGPLGEVSESHE